MAIIRGFDFPDHLFYLIEQDTWVSLESDGLATVGVTSLGCHISGDFMDFMPKPVGAEIERDRALALLEMSKTIRSVRSPVSGTVVSVNEEVKRQPGLLNGDPYGNGWLVRLKPVNWDADVTHLASGQDLAKKVERYMELYLVPIFGADKTRGS